MLRACIVTGCLTLTACSSSPTQEQLLAKVDAFSEACASKHLDKIATTVPADVLDHYKRVNTLLHEEFNAETFCSGKALRESPKKADGILLRTQGDDARLILYWTVSIPSQGDVYRSYVAYVFFRRTSGGWTLLDLESIYQWDSIEKLHFDESHVDEGYQLKRHRFRFPEYDFQVTTSISKKEIDQLVRMTREQSNLPIVSVRRERHPTDIVENWTSPSGTPYITVRSADPDAEDTIVGVTTARPSGFGDGSGETFLFEKSNGVWKLKSKGTWIA